MQWQYYPALRRRIEGIIREEIEQAVEREVRERESGKILSDNPVARLLMPPVEERTLSIGVDTYTSSVTLTLHRSNEQVPMVVHLGVTSYLTSRRMWSAYPEVIAMLQSLGIHDETCLYEIFHYLPGIAAIVERITDAAVYVLVGIRSAILAGTHSGMVSVPAGLLHGEESVEQGMRRELLEETGIREILLHSTVAARNPDAPNTTFVFRVETQEKTVRETYEAKGKRFIWVARDEALFPAMYGNTAQLTHAFQNAGIEVPQHIIIAPDILMGMQRLYEL